MDIHDDPGFTASAALDENYDPEHLPLPLPDEYLGLVSTMLNSIGALATRFNKDELWRQVPAPPAMPAYALVALVDELLMRRAAMALTETDISVEIPSI